MSAFNPYWQLFDRSADRRTGTPGRTTKIAIIGHSMGAAAVSKVQGTDQRVAAVVALDKLTGPGASGPLDGNGNKPVVPGARAAVGVRLHRLAVPHQRRLLAHPAARAPTARTRSASARPGTTPGARPASTACSSSRAPRRTWSTPTSRSCCPASRYGQDLSSHYVQAWLDRYLKHQSNDAALTGDDLPLPRAGRQRRSGRR